MSTPSLATIIARLDAAEARIRELEGGYGQTIYALRRDVTQNRIEMGSILAHLGLPRATDAQIDEALDVE